MNTETTKITPKSTVDTSHPPMPWRDDLGRVAATESPTNHLSGLQKAGLGILAGATLATVGGDAALGKGNQHPTPTIDTQAADSSQATQDILKHKAEVAGQFKTLHPAIPWRNIMAMRNKIVHEYFGLKLYVIWQTITQDLSALKKKIEPLLKELE